MDNKDVIIVDENEDSLSQEEIENINRTEHLKKLTKKSKLNSRLYSLLFKVIAILGLAGIFIAMLIESGTLIAISLGIAALSAAISYFFF